MWTWLIVSVNEPIVHYQSCGRHSVSAASCRHVERKWPPRAVSHASGGGGCGGRRRRSSLTLRVLAETAKLDGFAYTLTHAVCRRGEGGALSVPGHLVQTPTADLLQSSALVINHGTAARRRRAIPARDAVFGLRDGERFHPSFNRSAICRIRS